jgi:hypothetical protein
MLHEQQQTISMRSNVREWTHVLLMNTPCSHLHRVCATGVSSGLATRVTLTRVSRGRLGESIYTGVDLLLISFLYCSTWLLLGCVWNGTPCTWGLPWVWVDNLFQRFVTFYSTPTHKDSTLQFRRSVTEHTLLIKMSGFVSIRGRIPWPGFVLGLRLIEKNGH